MRHGSLFSGIGGFELAAEWMGWENVFHCEIDPFCRRILHYYWPESECYEDIRQLKAAKYRGHIDVLTGGFPCQPFSQAGRQKGTADDRYLWPEMCRVIGEIRPHWVIGENVLGLLNWRKGMVFDQVQADLEAQGYEVWSFVLPAAGVGAPHRRDRIWIVAHADPDGDRASKRGGHSDAGQIQKENREKGLRAGLSGRTDQYDPGGEAGNRRIFQREGIVPDWRYWPAQPPVCGGDDGIPRELDALPFSTWRTNSVSSFGNAIVPQLALQLFKAIEGVEAGLRTGMG